MDFNKLRVYQISIKLVVEIEECCNNIPYSSIVNDVSQIKRSASSIPSNIAEGFAKQVYPKEFIRFLNIALGSSDETQSHILQLFRKKYISISQYEYFANQYKNLSIKILNLIKYIKMKNNILN